MAYKRSVYCIMECVCLCVCVCVCVCVCGREVRLEAVRDNGKAERCILEMTKEQQGVEMRDMSRRSGRLGWRAWGVGSEVD